MQSPASEISYRYVDFHSHVLPGVDDGSPDAATSCQMLAESRRRGVTAMVATPHFYPEQERPEHFLSRRQRAVERLLDGGYDVNEHLPLFIGAEVAYFPGIARCDELDGLCIVGTDTILIEMPFSRWTSSVIDEVVSLRARRGLVPVLAHVDRYAESRHRALLESLAAQGVMLQINMCALERVLSRGRALRWLAEGTVQLVGSDCHNLGERAPMQDKALAYLSEHANRTSLDMVAAASRYALEGARTMERIAPIALPRD